MNYLFAVDHINQYIKNHKKKDWLDEFKYINNVKNIYTTTKAQLNQKKNRYENILPYDHSIVNLPFYINANWVLNHIATQGPTKETIEDFWTMIWLTNCTTIIMLTPLEEKGKIKCEKYWGDIYILNEYKDENNYIIMDNEIHISKHIIKREFIFHYHNQQKKITQYHYIDWSDFECPPVKSFIKLLNCITPYNTPLCIHCSAGVGRTGVLLTILSLMDKMNEKTMNVVETILELRQYRMELVQTKEQLEFCYKVIAYLNNNI
jgi:tyrosine-protein phosphatase non-receptor type 12/18/22